MDISIHTSGSTNRTEKFLQNLLHGSVFGQLSKYGEEGVKALSAATPVESGETARAWYYEILHTRGSYTIVWRNRHMAGHTPVAILLQYGHGTGTGGYVQGRDYINPAMQPLFDKIAEEAWKAVTSK